MNKRDFLKNSTVLGVTGSIVSPSSVLAQNSDRPPLKDITDDATLITVDERKARVSKAQKIMRKMNIDMLLIEAGSALIYFTGVRWRRSERFTGVLIPANGDITFITPFFEEPSVRESMAFGENVLTWHEHENPFDLVSNILNNLGLKKGRIAVEETVRHFIVYGTQLAAKNFQVVSGQDITRGCRMYKSPAEIALMQKANDVTIQAYQYVYQQIEEGMSPADIATLMDDATLALGGRPVFSGVLLNEASAYPHGTEQPQQVKKGGIILMDCGCSVHDYQSDISRTWVYGEPTKKHRKVWETVKRGQELALESATIGVPAGKVDDTVRAYYEKQGYGPGYQTPGLSHRLGHGIGMDGHEPVNFVHGEATEISPGMCFSNEPGIYIFGEFGVRLEDCLYMTQNGPKLFTNLSLSIDDPFHGN